jgi:hypothetical protein
MQHFAQKINALENMHYCYVVRFNKTDDARLGDLLSLNCLLKQFSAFQECSSFILLSRERKRYLCFILVLVIQTKRMIAASLLLLKSFVLHV